MGPFRIAALGVVASVVIVIVLSTLTGVDVAQVQQIGWPAFLTAVGVALLRLSLQGIRFYVLAAGLGAAVPLGPSVAIRVSSEFASLAMPTNVGSEVVRIPWLWRRGVELSRALWILFLELFLDVMATTWVSLAAVALALQARAFALAATLTIVVVPVAALYVTLFVISVRGRARVPDVVGRLVTRVLGPVRGARYVGQWNSTLEGYGQVARRPFGNRWLRTLLAALSLTIGLVLTAGLLLWVVFVAGGVSIDISTASLVAYAAGAFGALPISPGGSGLQELAASSFAIELYGDAAWAAVITWRIASYHVPLLLTGLLLLFTVRAQLIGSRPVVAGGEPAATAS